MRTLRIVAAVEAVSLVVLLANLATVHTEAITALGGPVHGAAYLAVIAGTWLVEAATPGARWLAVIPGVGGLLAVRRIQRAPAPATGEAGAS
ncbi:DUF3817 domain-containing protein [Micromonospora sp. C28SCA-DRY-2]|uniref:DUF3817 domain-containing protein n=1 Tax=Micromonospora sp. C28SCA-DRY-2 TaxID=3059522 RepID=UPI002674A399|nr:DUF3817 domain-containing protein [Micromonospora sp. C28SCA-DRY-2]MDO3705123.1 DUF3817 domain-containing protein [Micromonospora sp. C28SCA-DRY-2]